MELTRNNKRIEYIDIAKGITILLVILGHCLNDGIIRQYIYSFHMPLFYILSGYFFKKQKTKDLLKKGFKRLVLPYIVTSMVILSAYIFKSIIKQENVIDIAMQWIQAILYGSGEDRLFLGISIRAIGAIWFLISLFWAQLLFNYFLKINSRCMKIAFLIFFSLLGFILPNYIWLPFSIETAFVAILFLYVGYLMRNKKIFENKFDFKYKCIIFITWLIGAKFCKTLVDSNYYNFYYFNILIGICGSYLLIELSKVINIYTNYVKRFLQWCGENSLYILCVHGAEGRGIVPWGRLGKINNLFIVICRRFSFGILGSIVVVYLRNCLKKIGGKNVKKNIK